MRMPSEIVIEITGQCNMACTYCTNDSTRAGHMPFPAVKRILDAASRLHIPSVRFTGGEPLLVDDLPRMLMYAKQRGFYILLNTNATRITPQQLNILLQTVDNVLISLQGFNSASTQKMTRTRAPFEEKIRNIFLLRACLPVVRLGTVMTPDLMNNFKQYAALVKKIKPACWEIFRPMKGPAEGAVESRIHYTSLCRSLLHTNSAGIRAVIGNALPLCILPNPKLAAMVMAGARADDGHTRLVWDARGFFKPSYFITENLGTDLHDAWNHPFLKKIDTLAYLPPACGICCVLPQCLGGSRSLARQTSGSYFMPDPLFKAPSKAFIVLPSQQKRPQQTSNHDPRHKKGSPQGTFNESAPLDV